MEEICFSHLTYLLLLFSVKLQYHTPINTLWYKEQQPLHTAIPSAACTSGLSAATTTRRCWGIKKPELPCRSADCSAFIQVAKRLQTEDTDEHQGDLFLSLSSRITFSLCSQGNPSERKQNCLLIQWVGNKGSDQTRGSCCHLDSRSSW